MSLTHMNFSLEEGGGGGKPLDYENTINRCIDWKRTY